MRTALARNGPPARTERSSSSSNSPAETTDLSTVIPHGDDAYYRARPAIGHDAKTVLKINNYIGLHPNLAPIKELYDGGMAAVLQGVGYPNPNRSHFRSMDIWHSAQPDRDVAQNGWLGRYFDNTCRGSDPHVGVAIGAQLPLAMQGDRITPLSFDRPESYRYSGNDQDDYLKLNHKDGIVPAAAPSTQPAAEDRGQETRHRNHSRVAVGLPASHGDGRTGQQRRHPPHDAHAPDGGTIPRQRIRHGPANHRRDDRRRPAHARLLCQPRRIRHARWRTKSPRHADDATGAGHRRVLEGSESAGQRRSRADDDVQRVRPARSYKTPPAAPTTARPRRCS